MLASVGRLLGVVPERPRELAPRWCIVCGRPATWLSSVPGDPTNFCPDHSPVLVERARLVALEALAGAVRQRRDDGMALPDTVLAALDRLAEAHH